MNAAFVCLLEVCAPADRLSAKVLLSAGGWVTGVLWLTLVAYLLRLSGDDSDNEDLDADAWRLLSLHLIPAVPLLIAAALYLEESPRFLLSQGGVSGAERATAALVRMAEINKSPLPPNSRVAELPVVSSPHGAAPHVEEKRWWAGEEGDANGTPPSTPAAASNQNGQAAVHAGSSSLLARGMELFHPSIRRRTLLVAVAWFGSTCAYYGVALSPVHVMGEDIYLQNALGGLLELPAYLLMPILGDRFGRSRTWAGFLIVGSVPLLVLSWYFHNHHTHGHHAKHAAFNTDTPLVMVVLSLLARFGATGASAICYVAAAEQWPTSSRNLGVGFGASCGRLGSILAPLLRLTGWPSACLGGIGAAAADCGSRAARDGGSDAARDAQHEAGREGGRGEAESATPMLQGA